MKWKKEAARDLLALGSWIFYLIVIARALIKPYRPFVDQMIIAGVILLIFGLLVKESDGYLARGLVMVFFTSLFYQDNLFTGFVILAFLGMVISSYYVGNDTKKIGRGLVIGFIAGLIGYYLAGFSAELLGLGIGILVVGALRLVVPLLIFRWPLFGVLASLLLDAVDFAIAFFLGLGNFSGYHNYDKVFDTYYLGIAAIVSFKWMPLARWTSIGLFTYRLIGFILFEITGIRWLLLVFPNLFENFFIFELVRQKYFNHWKLTGKRLAVVLVILLIPKMIQEYILHYLKLKPLIWLGDKFGVSLR